MGLNKKWGIHLPNAEGIPGYGWEIIHSTLPDCVVLMIGAKVTSANVRQIVQANPDMKAVIGRWFTPPYASVEEVVQKYVEFVSDTSWNDAIPESMRWVSPWNEPNKADGGEGFGATTYQMERLNDALLGAFSQIRAANPTWKMLFPPLTPGNRDAYFAGDDEGLHYFMHGPEAAKPNPTTEEIEAAILSCKCRGALLASDGYGFHMYAVNDPEHELWMDWIGQRWQTFQQFFPKPLPIFIKELGIGKDPHYTTDYLNYLREHCPEVEAVAWYKLRDEPLNFFNGNPFITNLVNWIGNLEPIPEPPPEPPPGNGGEAMRARVGVVGTNDHNWKPEHHQAVQRMGLEAVGVMNYNNVADGQMLLALDPDVQFLVRLWSGGFGGGGIRETPQQFVDNTRIGLGVWIYLANGKDIYVQIHNEPNLDLEGWGPGEANALSFAKWFCTVYDLLRALFPQSNVHFGFPGLSPPFGDLEWVGWCGGAINKADFVCAHCYGTQGGEHLNATYGRRYIHYLNLIGHSKKLYITEFNLGPRPWDVMAPRYVEWYNQVIADSKVDYGAGTPSIIGALPFILASHDDSFQPLAWITQDGHFQPIVGAMEAATWPPLYDGDPEPPPPPPPPPDGDPPAECEEALNTTSEELACIIAADFHKVLEFYQDYGAPIATDNQKRRIICRWITEPGFIAEHGTWNDYLVKHGCREPVPGPPEPPVVDFYAVPLSGVAPLVVQFWNSSKGGEYGALEWDFGDGTLRADELHPIKVYEQPGVYTVTLVVWQDGVPYPHTHHYYITVTAPEPEPPEPPTARTFNVTISATVTVAEETGPDEPPSDVDPYESLEKMRCPLAHTALPGR